MRDALLDAGYAPLVSGEHRELSRILEREKPVLVLLDLVLPGTDGIALMETVPELADLPVIFISGYGRDETLARALEAGADDYIVKPFSPTVLIARVRAALRRHADPAPFMLRDLVIDYDLRRVSVAGRDVELSATKYALLRVLSLGAGRVRDLRRAAAQGVERARPCRREDRAGLRQAAAQQVRRRCAPVHLHRDRARGRLPHGPPG